MTECFRAAKFGLVVKERTIDILWIDSHEAVLQKCLVPCTRCLCFLARPSEVETT